jgi:hypothetical protein
VALLENRVPEREGPREAAGGKDAAATRASGGRPVVASVAYARAYSAIPQTTRAVRDPRRSETAPNAGGPTRRPTLPQERVRGRAGDEEAVDLDEVRDAPQAEDGEVGVGGRVPHDGRHDRRQGEAREGQAAMARRHSRATMATASGVVARMPPRPATEMVTPYIRPNS